MNIIQAVILAIVEGLTEYLPVSSTGHMIITSSLMGIASDDFTKMFTIAIQFGAIISVVVLYYKKFLQIKDWQFYARLIIAFVPAAIIGKLFNDQIDLLLESVWTVAITLLVGGVILIFVDQWFNNKEEVALNYKKSFVIGLFQCIAMIPGVSRSAATIIGGMTQKLTRKDAAEFSFFLAVPTMFAATGYKMLKYFSESENGFSSTQLQILVFGNIVAFVVALLAIKFFIAFLTKYGFKVFGYYRIALGLVLILLLAFGVKLEIG